MRVGVANKPLAGSPRSVRHAKRRLRNTSNILNLLIWTESVKIQAIHKSMSTCSQEWERHYTELFQGKVQILEKVVRPSAGVETVSKYTAAIR